MITIAQAGTSWLRSVKESRSQKTFETYQCSLKFFFYALARHNQNPVKTPAMDLTDRAFVLLIDEFHKDSSRYSVATELLYIAGIRGFFSYLVAEDLADVNMEKIKTLIHQRARRAGRRLPEFPEHDIESVIIWVEKKMPIAPDGTARLRDLRNKALILTLADTGLRIHEACALKRKDINWDEANAEIIGKGNKQAIVYFSQRAMKAIDRYLHERTQQADGSATMLLMDQPIFTRHDKAMGKKIAGIKTGTGRRIVEAVVNATPLVEGYITPHKFRHYFVTMILNETNDLAMTKELARHSNIEMTSRYIHKSRGAIGAAYHKAIDK